MAIICGLGNPEERYSNTPHNAGYWVTDALATHLHTNWQNSSRFLGQIATAETISAQGDAHRHYLLKPTTYMNLSGQSLAALAQYYKIKPQDCLIIVDDIALPLGTLRLRATGGHGGHNGLRSIEQHLGTEGYPRLRFGIAPTLRPTSTDLATYVLQPLPKAILDILSQPLQLAAALAHEFLKNGYPAACALHSKHQTQKKQN